MIKEYNSNDDKTISQWMLNEDHIIIFCKKLIGFKFTDSIYNVDEIEEDELRYSVSKNMKGDIVRTYIYLFRNERKIHIAIFLNDKIILSQSTIQINELHEIVKEEMREVKINELGI